MKQRKPRKTPKAERISRLLRQRVAYDRSRPQTNTRESYLRSLMGLPTREAAP
jgi:hypothetical protein